MMPAAAVDLLVPRPQLARAGRGPALRVAGPARWRGAEDVVVAAARRRLERAFAAAVAGTAAGDAVPITAALRGDGLGPGEEAFRLRLDASGILLEARTPVGLFRAATVCAQWLAIHHRDGGPALVPSLEAAGAPDLAVRGVMLDISRDKVPTPQTLRRLVDLLADLGVNQLQLYMEHTFAYAGHEAVWRDASPLGADEVRALDRYARERFIELVPNQNSFGHFHRWLVHEPYRALAECPEGVDHPFSRGREPFSLCPTDPRALALLADLYDQLLPCFASREVNVGLDETLDLGLGRSAPACQARGKTSVYLEFVRAIHGLLAARDRRMQMWGDIVLQHPERIAEIPQDATVLAWGYEADHPFAEDAARFAAAGRRFLLCPGTSSWLSFAGRIDNMLANVAAAARAARASGAAGILVTDWGDQGHLQPLAASVPGLLAGAQAGWNADAVSSLDVAALERQLAIHALGGDAAVAAALVGLGNAYRRTGTPSRNGSALAHLLLAPGDDLEHVRYRGLSRQGLDAVLGDVETARAALVHAASSPAATELRWVAGLLELGARVGLARLEAGPRVALGALPGATRAGLRHALEASAAEHAVVWDLRNRPGGRADSAARFDPLRLALAAR